MTTEQIVLSVFGVIIGGLLLPLSSGKRTGLWVALIIASVMTALVGSMMYIKTLFE